MNCRSCPRPLSPEIDSGDGVRCRFCVGAERRRRRTRGTTKVKPGRTLKGPPSEWRVRSKAPWRPPKGSGPVPLTPGAGLDDDSPP